MKFFAAALLGIATAVTLKEGPKQGPAEMDIEAEFEADFLALAGEDGKISEEEARAAMTEEGLTQEEQDEIIGHAAMYAGEDELLDLDEAKQAIADWMDEESMGSEGSEVSEWDTEDEEAWEAEVKGQIAAIAGDDEKIDEDELRAALEEEGVSDWEIDEIVDHAADYADEDGKVGLDAAWEAYNDWMADDEDEEDWDSEDEEVWGMIEDIAGEDEMIDEDELRGALAEAGIEQGEADEIVAYVGEMYADEDGLVYLDSAWDAYWDIVDMDEEEEE